MREFKNCEERKKNRRKKERKVKIGSQIEMQKEFKTFFYQLLSHPHIFFLFLIIIILDKNTCKGIGPKSSLTMYILGLWPNSRT